MKKKNKIILGSVVAICAIGLVSSIFIDWPVDMNDAGGDIAKSSRFSRKQATEKLTNMEELLQNDQSFKDGIVAAQVVMQTRAAQFASLVDMSNEVAGGIPEFGGLLKEMNANRVTVENVNNSLVEAGGDLDAALGGKECPDLAQNTINAALAYTTLQKQNKLADQFIEATDKYLETAQGDDRLKFVRDQWLEYQQVTAALDGDKESADKLASKGNLLTAEKSLAALASFGPINQIVVFNNCYMAQQINVPTGLASNIPTDAMGAILTIARNTASAVQQTATEGAIHNSQTALAGFTRTAPGLRNATTEGIAKAFTNATGAYAKSLGQAYKEGLNQAQKGLSQTQNGLAQTQNGLNQVQKGLGQTQQGLGQVQKSLNQTQQGLNQTQNSLGMVLRSTVQMASAANVMSSFDRVIAQTAGATALQQSQGIGLCNMIGDVINQTAIGNKATFGNRAEASN